MSKPSQPSLNAQSPQLKIRLPAEILTKVQDEARKNFRTISAEIAYRLHALYAQEGLRGDREPEAPF